MRELIEYIVGRFAEKEVEYRYEENGRNLDVLIVLDESDMGKVIGRQGKLAKAIRTLAKAQSAKENVRVNVEIKSKEEVNA